MSTIPNNATIVAVDTRLQRKIITLPSVISNPGRMLVLKDYYGTTQTSTITLVTQDTDLIDDTSNNTIINTSYGTITLLSDGIRSWRVIGSYAGALSYATSISRIPDTVLAGSVTISYNNITVNLTTTWARSTLATYYIVTFYSNSVNSYAGASLFERTNVLTGLTRTTTTLLVPINNTWYFVSVAAANYLGVSSEVNSTTLQVVFSGLFVYTGADQTFIPIGSTYFIYVWGAGGSGAGSGGAGGYGGAGAYISGQISVVPGRTYRIVVGGGGRYNAPSNAYGGGGQAIQNQGNEQTGGGGGRSAVIDTVTGIEVVTAAAGGGASYAYNGGFGNWNGTGQNGGGPYPGLGGSTSAGGAAGRGGGATAAGPGPTNGGLRFGGDSADYCGAGGSGYYGGGGGNNDGAYGGTLVSGGGGGSSYFGGLFGVGGENSPNSSWQPPGTSNPRYTTGIAAGGAPNTSGGNGLIAFV